MFADNVDFSGGKTAAITANGQLLIGSAVAPNIRVGTLASADASVTITTGNGTIDLSAGVSVPTTFNADAGSATPAMNQLTIAGGTGIGTTGAGSTITINLDTPVTVPNGGTGNTSLTGGGILLGAGAGALTVTAQPTNGQLLIGSTGFNPVLATLTDGTGIVITEGAGTITIDASATTPLSFPTDSGTATPAANALTIAGGPGITTSGSGSTVTINSVVFTDTAAAVLVADNGYFATGAGTYNLPATPAQGEVIHIIADTAGAVALDAPVGDFIRVGSVLSSDGGTATSTAIGDSLTLRFRNSSQTWIATAVQGIWLLA